MYFAQTWLFSSKRCYYLSEKAKEEAQPRANTGIEFGQYSMTTAVVQGPKKKLSIFMFSCVLKEQQKKKSLCFNSFLRHVFIKK